MSTQFHQHLDSALTKLSQAHSALSGTFVVVNGDALGTPTPTSPLRVTLIHATTQARSHFSLTGRSGNTFTGSVADGYTDIAFPAGSRIQSRIVAADWNDIQTAINALETDGSLALGQPVANAVEDGLLLVDNGDLSNSASLTWDDASHSFKVKSGSITTKVQATTLGVIGTESNHDLGIFTNDTQRILITAGGQVKIGAGTGSGSSNSGLDVAYNANSEINVVGSSNPSLKAVSTTNSVRGKLQALDSGTQVYVGSESNHPANLITNNVVRVKVTAAGLVGVNESSPGAQLQVNTSAANVKGLIVKGFTSQTSNLTEWQNSSGTVQTSISSAGKFSTTLTTTGVVGSFGANGVSDLFTIGYQATINGAVQLKSSTFGPMVLETQSNNNICLLPNGTGKVGIGTSTPRSSLDVPGTVILGTPGSLHGVITSNDGLYINTDVNATGTNDGRIVIGTGRAYDAGGTVWAYFDRLGKLGIANGTTTPGAQVQINTSASNVKALIVKGSASQTAFLTEWQDSTGAFLASIASNGNLSFNPFASTVPSNRGVVFANAWAIYDEGSLVIGKNASSAYANSTALIVETGTNTAQTVDIQKWRVAGGGAASLASISAKGEVKAKGIATAITSKTAAYTLTTSDSIVTADATTAAFAVTLPAASAVPAGRQYTVKKTDASANAVTLARAGSDIIDGSNTYALASQFAFVSVVSNGVDAWFVIGAN